MWPGLARQLGMGGQDRPAGARCCRRWRRGGAGSGTVGGGPVAVPGGLGAGAGPGSRRRWRGGGCWWPRRAWRAVSWRRGCAAALRERAGEVIVVTVAGGAEPGGAGRAGSAGCGRPVAGVVSSAGWCSLLAVDERAGDACPGSAAVPRCSGLAGTLVLVQALGDAGIAAPLWVLTRGAVAAGRARWPARGRRRCGGWAGWRRWSTRSGGAGWSMCRAVLDERAAARLCGRAGRADGEDQVAVRGAGVLARRLVRAPLGAGRPARAGSPRGTVLVTGGTGALGGHVARWLAGAGRAARGAGQPPRPGRGGRRGAGRRAAAPGRRVTVAACDVADRGARGRAAGAAGAAGLPLTAVFHTAAGVRMTRLERG